MRKTRTDPVARFEDEFRRRGLALTIQRRVVFEELSGRKDHPTSDQIYEALHVRLPGLSRTTVYRVLETLVDAGMARRVHHAGPAARFDPVTSRHHHLVCDVCGALTDLDDGAVPPLPTPGTRGSGFSVRDYSVTFTGLCSRCR